MCAKYAANSLKHNKSYKEEAERCEEINTQS